MKALDRYLAVTIRDTILLVTFVLLGIVTLFSMLAEIENIKAEYRLADAFMYILLTTPRRFYDMIPYCALIGCLLGLGGLSSSSELTVMRAAGVSRLRISIGAMIPVLILVLIGLAVGEWLVPQTERTAQLSRESALSDQITSEFGFWYREGNTYMHFLRVESDGSLSGITHYITGEKGRIERTLYAETGNYYDGEGGSYWILHNVRETVISGKQIKATTSAQKVWETRLDPDLLRSEILVQPDKLSIVELNDRITYLDKQELNSQTFRQAFWQKLLQPLATLSLVFVAITFIFGPLREVPMGVRVVAGLIVGILFKFLQDLLAPASMVYGFAPVYATVVPILMCFAFGAWMLRRGI